MKFVVLSGEPDTIPSELGVEVFDLPSGAAKHCIQLLCEQTGPLGEGDEEDQAKLDMITALFNKYEFAKASEETWYFLDYHIDVIRKG